MEKQEGVVEMENPLITINQGLIDAGFPLLLNCVA